VKGYYTNSGFMGYVEGEGYRLFENDTAYYEWAEDETK
jgi:hypothetical protein